MFKNSYSPGKFRYNEKDNDELSTSVVEDLLQGTSEWRNIQDIVRVTLKSLTDVVKIQGETIKNLEKTITTKASKNELNSALTLKANTSEVSRLHSDFYQKIEERPTLQDLSTILTQYPTIQQFNEQTQQKVSLDEVQTLIKSKANSQETKNEITTLQAKFKELELEIEEKIGNSASVFQYQELSHKLDQKADLIDVNLALESKANKASVQQALHRKANKTDAGAISQKEIQEIFNLIKEKADQSYVEKLNEQLNKKQDKHKITKVFDNLAEKNKLELEIFQQQLQQERQQYEEKLAGKIDSLYVIIYKLLYDKFMINCQQQNQEEINKMNQNIYGQISYKNELQKQIQDFGEQLDQKLDGEVLNQLTQQIQFDIDKHMDKIKNELFKDQKSNQKDNLVVFELMQEELKKLSGQLQKIRGEQMSSINTKIKTLQVKQKEFIEIQQQRGQIHQELEQVKQKLEEQIHKKVDKKEYQEYKRNIKNQLEEKTSIQEIQEALNASQNDVSNRFIEFKQQIQESIDQLAEQLYSKITLEELNQIMSQKPDLALVQQLIEAKFNFNNHKLNNSNNQVQKSQTSAQQILQNQNFNSLNNFQTEKEIKILKQQIGDIKQQNQSQNKQLQDIQNQFEQIEKDVTLKASIKDICSLLDEKASVDEVTKALSDIQQQINEKVTQEDLNNVIQSQSIINESLCTENIIGRWSWKSGNIKKDQIVPWESQLVNTLPDNFLWDQDEPNYITSVAPGLYQVQYGFFSSNKPDITLCINGEPIIQNQIKQKQEFYPESNITGTTLTDYIVLPGGAQLSVIFKGDAKSTDGFMGLKRI